MWRIVCLLTFSLFLLACGSKEKSLPYFNTPEFTPLFIKAKSEAEKEVTHIIGEFSFQNQNGKTITDREVANKIHIANFIFTSCGSICPVMTDHMKMVNKVFGNDSSVVM